MKDEKRETRLNSEPKADARFVFNWIATAMLAYVLLSGICIWLLPFGRFGQFSILLHSAIGVLIVVPVCVALLWHWRRRRDSVDGKHKAIAMSAVALLGFCLVSGLYAVWNGVFGGRAIDMGINIHWLSGLGLGIVLTLHLIPVFGRYRKSPPTARRPARARVAAVSGAAVIALLGLPWILAESGSEDARIFTALSDAYEWPYGDDRPFWPSRAELDNPVWKTRLQSEFETVIAADELQRLLDASLSGDESRKGPLTLVEEAVTSLQLSPPQLSAATTALEQARHDMKQAGALQTDAYPRAESCGNSGCHTEIYREWRPSAHGFAAEDSLFLRVQELLAAAGGAAETRSCAGCHDPLTLLSGARDGSPISEGRLAKHDGVSCVVCHSITETTTAGNGSYRLTTPTPYLFENTDNEIARLLQHFLVRRYPQQHVRDYSRDLYRSSEFCAACHKQVPLPAADTDVGLAQEQNEYDSWKNGRWYHEDNPEQTIECRECHMPLVASDDPASGDIKDSYRHSLDGRHRSHRVLASNMYVPALQSPPGWEEQVQQTIAWLRGEIDIPEIEHKWVTGPVVDIEISAPDQIVPGELVNITLFLHNNKTGHDFPAGPLDLLESWVELKVSDNLGRTLLLLGDENSENAVTDAPIVYKADWYDKRGLPVESHNLWDVVGASYKNALESDTVEIADIPFQCPGIGRPRISESYSEKGPGERKTDVVFSLDGEEMTELHVTARLLFRKANPKFLENVFGIAERIDAPVIELVSASHIIAVVPDR
jgi:Cytochrome c554 and c-prime